MAGPVDFVGREAELSRLLGALGENARMVLVVGDAGVGKTRFATELDKRHFLEDLIKFLCNHCDPDRFTPRVYEGLHQHLGHIAHHDRRGFYEEWFADLSSRIRFLEHHAQGQVWGDWKDVDEAFKKWLNGVEGRAVLHHYRTELENKSEAAERQQLAKLKAKYEGGDGKAKEATA